MNNTDLFIEITNSILSEIPVSRNKFDKEYFDRLYSCYGVPINPTVFGTNEIKNIIKDRIHVLLERNDIDFIVHKDLKNIERQIIWKHIVFSNELEPYFNILFFIWDMFRDVHKITPLNCTAEWKNIIKLIKEYQDLEDWSSKNHKLFYSLEDRAIATGNALKYFNEKHGLKINFNDGYIDLTEEIETAIYEKIEYIIKYVGGINIISCILFINQNNYNAEQHRFHFIRNLSDIEIKEPDIPIGYLINICLKYLRNSIEIPYEEINKNIIELFELTKNYCTLYDVQSYNLWEDLLISHEDLPYKLHEFALYDTIFTVNQFNPYELREFLKFIFADFQIVSLNINYYIDFISDIIESCKDPFKPYILHKKSIYKKHTKLLTTTIDKILDIFSYNYFDINTKYKFPNDYNECNAMLKPLVNIGSDKYFLLNSSMCAMNAYEALMIRLREQVDDLDSRIGCRFEEYIKKLFTQKNISFHSAEYKNGNGQCDIVIETNKQILFIEVKKKALTRIAKSGNDVQIFLDLSKSMVDSLIQLNNHEINLRNTEKLELENYTIYLNRRDVEKMTLVMHDYGAMQDYTICDQILRNIEIGDYDIYDQKYKNEFEKSRIKFKELNEQMSQINLWKTDTRQSHMNYKFLSLSQLLIILDNSSSNETFMKNFMKIKHVALYNHDFYSLYAYINRLGGTAG
jgi:hypothetical protein